MSMRSRNTVAGTTDAGLPKRRINGSNPPNKPGTTAESRSTVTDGSVLEGPGDVVQGPTNGPDQINR